nr:immunoglobulin heavy chain junction region [Macaca mulatta]MOY25584.1 immunoglobulin heavy chain junction region [Macaca mulatta]MOY28900.1 immunoglobulin heavy chain junction region [Macaca mulatta]
CVTSGPILIGSPDYW